jgi:transcriptional regulator with XRE-family HTH domain
MGISPELCRAARGLLGWSQQELASRAQVARKTIADFELSQVRPHPRTLRDVVAALEAAGVEFLPAEANVSRGGIRVKWDAWAEVEKPELRHRPRTPADRAQALT